MVKIRLSRIGKKKAPFYRVVAVDSRKKRDGAYLENLGTYDALNTVLVQFDEERFNYWIEQGAQPSDSVKKIVKLYKKPKGEEKKASVAKVKTKAKAEVEVGEAKPEPKAAS